MYDWPAGAARHESADSLLAADHNAVLGTPARRGVGDVQCTSWFPLCRPGCTMPVSCRRCDRSAGQMAPNESKEKNHCNHTILTTI